jgi:hypothetical protein
MVRVEAVKRDLAVIMRGKAVHLLLTQPDGGVLA